MKLRKLLRILHRDFGYFIAGMTIVYGLSGIFLNHRHDFNPDYKIFITDFTINRSLDANAGEDEIKAVLESLDRNVVYKKHYLNNQGLIKIFIENGEIVIHPQERKGTMQYLQKRPVIFEMNKLHKATIGSVWKWTSDIMAVILIFVAVSGLFLLKGKRGFCRWGWWFAIAGIIVPLFFVIAYM
ncbi:MAG: PepSY-associated TM helix domain-containing protein [Prolixibacteraceae bacterium]|nr:PepSY-associated TM helix domain-containing protein [Prolixibacteraceae bacterium]